MALPAAARLLLLCSYSEEMYKQSIQTLCRSYQRVELSSSVKGQAYPSMLLARKLGATHIATTNFYLFKLLTGLQLSGSPNDNYGTMAKFTLLSSVDVIFIPPLTQLYKVPEGQFLLQHYLEIKLQRKLLNKDRFRWQFVTPKNLETAVSLAASSPLVAIDIETSKVNLLITSCSYTILLPDFSTETYVVKFPDSLQDPCPAFALACIRRLNATPSPKVMQNGQYDSTYFIRFNAPVINWRFDTAYFQHSIFPELPKDLAFISSFYLHNFIYWKDESGTNLYEYNAKDTHNTLWTFLAQLHYCRQYSCTYSYANFARLFPVNFPALSCGLDGMLVNEDTMAILRVEAEEKKEEAQKKLALFTGYPKFNPGSPKQVGLLFEGLGFPQEGTDKVSTQKFYESSELNVRVVDYLRQYRKSAKAISTYFSIQLLHGRLLYQLNPHGTETSRMASKASNFWCGTQIQNIPPYGRTMVEAEPGWTFVAVDKKQSESYCTGYLVEEEALINAVNTSPDFHCQNASMFFGIPFDELWDTLKEKPKRKDIRDLAKRVNHGANYNMQAGKLLETMGTKNVMEAKRLLGLSPNMRLIDACKNLLARFDKVYPKIRGKYHADLKAEIRATGKLYIAATNTTRRTFLRPDRSKLDLNAAASHKSQSLSVLLVNESFIKCWRELQIKKYPGQYRLKAQVHDEIVSIVKDELVEQVAQEQSELMTIPIEINGRLMVIPSSIATGKLWSECK